MPGRQLQEARHTVIEFMVAGNDEIIAHGIHDLYDGFAGRQLAERRALNCVAGIYQSHGMSLFLQIFFVLGYFINPQIVGNTAVNIISVQDDDFLACRYDNHRDHQCCQQHKD